VLAKPNEDFGEIPCRIERLSAEVTGAVPVRNWWEQRIRLCVLGQVQGVVATSVPPPVAPIAICWGLSKATPKQVLLMLKLITMFGAFFPPSSLECNLVLEKLLIFCTTCSCWLFFVHLCHWAGQSLDGFTGSITCEGVWECR